jgi:hypothetical protein
VKQLETLDISKGILTDDSVDLFETDAFAHLTIDVSETFLSKDAQGKLASLCKRLIANDMRDEGPDDRYVRVGE